MIQPICSKCGLLNPPDVPKCLGCDARLQPDPPPRPVSPPTPVQHYIPRPAPPPAYYPSPPQPPVYHVQLPWNQCRRCFGLLVQRTEATDKGSGCVVLLLGFLFAPLLIGIPIMIYGIVLMNKSRSYLHCTGCGTIFPC